MPVGRYRSITISEEVYNKLKKMAEKERTSMAKVLERIVLNLKDCKNVLCINDEDLRIIIRDEIYRIVDSKLESLKSDLIKLIDIKILQSECEDIYYNDIQINDVIKKIVDEWFRRYSINLIKDLSKSLYKERM